MANRGNRADQRNREHEADERAAHGQSRALGDTGDRKTGVDPSRQGISNRQADLPEDEARAAEEAAAPPTEAGAPPPQEQERTSLDDPSQSGRPKDESDAPIERTGQQMPRSDPEAVRPLGSPGPDDTTM